MTWHITHAREYWCEAGRLRQLYRGEARKAGAASLGQGPCWYWFPNDGVPRLAAKNFGDARRAVAFSPSVRERK